MFQAKLRQAVADDLVTELKKATLHVNGAIPKEASGKSCPTSTAQAIKEKCQTVEANFYLFMAPNTRWTMPRQIISK